jgi:2-dehydrotetronate isomerase
MPKFAANLSMMFNEAPFLDRFAAAAAAGFRAVEFLFPYDYPAETIAAKLRENHLENVLFNLPPGDWAAGERGIACLPGREEEFRAGVEKALAYAERLGTPRIHAMPGIAPAGIDRQTLRATFVANLRWAAEKLASRGITLLVEAINTRDIPGYFLNTQADSYALCAEIGAPNLKMQMDLYHMQIVEGDLAMRLRQYIAHCGHIQIAGVPARNEPDTGEVNYPYVFRLLEELGYAGWIGCEYRPAGKTVDGLGWLQGVQ